MWLLQHCRCLLVLPLAGSGCHADTGKRMGLASKGAGQTSWEADGHPHSRKVVEVLTSLLQILTPQAPTLRLQLRASIKSAV